MDTNTNLHAATDMLRDFYNFDARLCQLYTAIHGDTSDAATARLRSETDHVEALIKEMIETAALEASAA